MASNYEQLTNDLRDIEKTMFALGTSPINMDNVSIRLAYDKKWGRTANDAAAAIEALQARVSKLEERTKAQQERLEDYMEKQTYIDHYGDKWMTSAKDVPTAAYEHGYADGWHEAIGKMEVQDADT